MSKCASRKMTAKKLSSSAGAWVAGGGKGVMSGVVHVKMCKWKNDSQKSVILGWCLGGGWWKGSGRGWIRGREEGLGEGVAVN